MFFIRVSTVRGTVTAQNRRALHLSIASAVTAVCGPQARSDLFIEFDEAAEEQWSVGGYPLRTADILAMRDNQPEQHDRSGDPT